MSDITQGPHRGHHQRVDSGCPAAAGLEARRLRCRRRLDCHERLGGGRAGVSFADSTGASIPIAGFAMLTMIFSLVGVVIAAVMARKVRRPRSTFRADGDRVDRAVIRP